MSKDSAYADALRQAAAIAIQIEQLGSAERYFVDLALRAPGPTPEQRTRLEVLLRQPNELNSQQS